MRRWTLPRDYAGAEWPDHWVFLGQHRDSDTVTRSNFRVGLQRLLALWPKWETAENGENVSRCVVRESHWAVGWVEWIAVHKDDVAVVALAQAMADKIADYPLLDKMDHDDLEWSEMSDCWRGMGKRERMRLLVENGASFLGARHDFIPRDAPDGVLEALRGD